MRKTRTSMADAPGRSANAAADFEAQAESRRRGLAPPDLDGDASEAAQDMAEGLLALILRLDNSVHVTVHLMTDAQTFDIHPDKTIGHDPTHAVMLNVKLAQLAENGGSIVLRQFTDKMELVRAENGQEMLMPWKRVYGAFIQGAQMSRMPTPGLFMFTPAEVIDCFSEDAETSESIEPEKFVDFRDFEELIIPSDHELFRLGRLTSNDDDDA